MAVTVFPAGLAVGNGDTTTKAGVMCALTGSFDPTSSSQVSLGTLPAGATVIDVLSYGEATGGTNPTVDIGTSGDDDGFANELDADNASSAVADDTTGALINTRQTSDTEVFGKVGASAAGGGTLSVAVIYILTDA